jgi:hypothetical protein
MDKLSEWINEWIKFATLATRELSQVHGREISASDFHEAVLEKLGYAEESDLFYEALPEVAVMVDLLRDYPFATTSPKILQEIVVYEKFIPDDVVGPVEEQTIKSKNYVWRIHQDDDDPFPSSPHAHDVSSSLKLHLGTGKLYKKRKLISQISCKHLMLLRSKVNTHINLPAYEC